MASDGYRETSKSLLTEAFKALAGGAIGGTLFGVLGAYIYGQQSGVMSCKGFLNSQYDGTSSIINGNRLGCTKVVDLPVLGHASSASDAATSYGVTIALIVFVGAFLILALSSD